MTSVERLEELINKNAEVDWDFDELCEISTALPDLLKAVRAAGKASDLLAKLDPEFEYLANAELAETLEPLFHEQALEGES